MTSSHLPESLLSLWVNAELEVDRVLLSIARYRQLITALGPVQAWPTAGLFSVYPLGA